MQLQPKVRTHTGAQHFGAPQRRCTLEGQHLVEAKSPGAAQYGAHVACVLHAIQNHGGSLGGNRRYFGQVDHKTELGGRLQPTDVTKQHIGDHYRFDSCPGIFHLGLRPK